jgi:hypothetical protein
MTPSELMQDSAFMADFARATKGDIKASELRAKYGLSTDTLRSVIDAVAAGRSSNGTAGRPAKRARKKPGITAKAIVDTASLLENQDFILDFCRFSEGILDEKFLRRKYKCFDQAAWEKLGSDEVLIERIEDERLRRVRDGSAAREHAQKIFTAAPPVLGSILNDGKANARHRIEASKELRAISANGPEGGLASERFQITIVLNADGSNSPGDTIHFDKPIKVGIEDDTNTAPQELVAIAAMSKPTEGGGGSNTL